MTTSESMRSPVELEGSRYVTSEMLELAVRVAKATQRPLLLFGDPGSGKSSLAKYVAYTEKRRYYEHVITARTEAKDLLWTFDSVRRLGDAQAKRIGADVDYILPGVLWWAFDQAGASRLPRSIEPFATWNARWSGTGAVVLIDEIDKADPDLPNSLLVPLAGRYFTVAEVGGVQEVSETGKPSLIVITSNQERDLPPAFVRRCVVHHLDAHTRETLLKITSRHLDGRAGPPGPDLIDHLIAQLKKERDAARDRTRRAPSTAEFLDAVNACRQLSVDAPDHPDLPGILEMIFKKDGGTHQFYSG